MLYLNDQQRLHVRGQTYQEREQSMATTNATPTFADAGTLLNDATRFLESGLWQNAVSEGGQGLGSAARVATDLKTVQADLQAEIAAGQYTGQALTDVQNIVANLDQEIAAANASVNGGSLFGRVAATGFQAVPAGPPAGTTAQNAPHAHLANIGAILNDAANLMIGGVNSSHVGLI